ncbi:hypothetical protein [Paenisporosarcina sp.]|uniref:hypothetical protein n=1 Tax=Paenisporosarcina sp. TaxID=1932001 RepID=UPI003C775FE3
MIVRNFNRLYIAIGIFVLVMILNLPFPHAVPFGTGSIWIMNIPIEDADGFNLAGLFSLAILCIGVCVLATSLEKYRVRLVFLALVLYSLLPLFAINVYQHTFASGIYAIAYDLESSECNYEQIDDNRMDIICDLPFKNSSDDEVKFDFLFLKEGFFDEQNIMVPLLNEDGPYEVILQGHETKVVRIQSELDIPRLNGFSGGGSYEIHIEIFQGNKMRLL